MEEFVASSNNENTNSEMAKRRGRGITGSTLKLIAITTMLIDHIGAVLVEKYIVKLMESPAMEGLSRVQKAQTLFRNGWFSLDIILRAIGRLGFPIFCFLLVEGFTYTRNKAKYVIRLGIFAIISEIPFDLAFNNKVVEFGYQNVFFTLFLGMLVMIGLDIIQKKIPFKESKVYLKLVFCILYVLCIAFGMVAATLLKTDYAAMGVLTIVVMYILRRYRKIKYLGGCITLSIMSLSEIPAMLGLIPIAKYNGQRGLKLKYIFYAFYPGHLLILYIIRVMTGF